MDLVQKNEFESIQTSRAVVSSNVIGKQFLDVFNSFQQTFMSYSAENLFLEIFQLVFFPILLKKYFFSGIVNQHSFKAKSKRCSVHFKGSTKHK